MKKEDLREENKEDLYNEIQNKEDQNKETGSYDEKPTAKPKSTWPLYVRIIAALLVILLIGELALSNMASVKFNASKYADTEYSEAAEYLEENDEYISSTKLERMRAVVRTLQTPKTYEQYFLFASVAIADGDYAKAVEYLKKCIELYEGEDDKELSELYIKCGCLWALQGDWDMAAEELKKGLELDPSNADGQLMIAEVYLRTENYEKALEYMELYEKENPLDASQYIAVATMQFSLGRYAEAVNSCDLAMEQENCDKASVLYLRAQCYYMMEEYDKAQSDSERCYDEGGDELETKLLGAMCCENRGDLRGALDCYRSMIDAGLQDQSLYERAVSCAYSLDDYESMASVSASALEKLELDENSALDFKKWLGIAQLELENYADAEKNLSAYIDADDSVKELFYLRGLCRLSIEDYAGAEKDFTESMTQEDIQDESQYNRAVCRLQLEDSKGAAADFEEILTRNKDPQVIAMVYDLLGLTEEDIESLTAETEKKK